MTALRGAIMHTKAINALYSPLCPGGNNNPTPCLAKCLVRSVMSGKEKRDAVWKEKAQHLGNITSCFVLTHEGQCSRMTVPR